MEQEGVTQEDKPPVEGTPDNTVGIFEPEPEFEGGGSPSLDNVPPGGPGREDEEPETLKEFSEDGAIEISRLLNDPDVIDAAIRTTKTAAIMEDVLPKQIKRSDY